MKRLCNTIYILTPGTYLFCQDEAIGIKIGGVEKIRIPAHTIDSIVCMANTTITSPFVEFCSKHVIALSFHSDYGKFYGRIYGAANGNVLLRKRQYELINNPQSHNLVRNILYGKFANSRNIILRAARDTTDETIKEKLRVAAEKIAEQTLLIDSMSEIDSMRGVEGVVANSYFGVFDLMLKTPEKEMLFKCRSRRPPLNNTNALMSFVYMLLKNDVQSALESIGLDVAAGYLHTLRPGRPSFALDMMEELRAPLSDRFVISLINLKQIKFSDFENETGEFRLSEKARRTVIDSWQKRKREDIIHPFLEEKIPIGLIPYAQGMLIARYLRGDLNEYPPFLWR